MTIPASVSVAVDRAFPDAQRREALSRLPEPGELPQNAPVERVLLAIVALAEGDLDKLSHFAQSARGGDWRDLLYWDEHPRRADEPASWDELRSRLRLPGGDETSDP